tara:strand:- start:99 stop:1736 length:1638 start_codon:yes stop_codon:yes gene_type:complete
MFISDYSSAKKALKNKQYDSAVYYVSSSLHAKPNNKKGIKLLEIAYPQAVKYHQQRINSLITQKGSKSFLYSIKNTNSAKSYTGWTNAWQKFSTTNAGPLINITLKLQNTHATDNYNLYLDLYSMDNSPSNANPVNKFLGIPVLTSNIIKISSNTSSPTDFTFIFDSDVNLSANTSYYFWLKSDGYSGRVYMNNGEQNGGSGNNFGSLYNKVRMGIFNEDKEKWSQLVDEYEALIRLGSEINRLRPVLLSAVNYNLILTAGDYTAELAEAKPRAADYHYTKGMDYREDITKQSQKQAAINFKLALKYVPGYMNAQELYEETKAAATFTLLIRPFDGPQSITGFIRNQMMMQQTTASKEFLRIITRDQLRTILNEQGLVQAGITENNYMEIGKLSGADHILSATIVTTYRPVEIINNEISQEREVTVRKESYVDSAGVKRTKNIKGKVKAKVKHFKKSTGATLNLSYQIMGINSGEMVFYGTVKKRENFLHEWATFKGDDRALSDYYKGLVKRQEVFAPSKGDLYMEMSRAVPHQFHNKIYQHYSN